MQHAKIEPPYFSGQINKAKVSTQLYQAMLWWPRIDVHKKGYTRTAVAAYDDFTTISLRKEEEKNRNQLLKFEFCCMKDEDWILLNLQSLENPGNSFRNTYVLFPVTPL